MAGVPVRPMLATPGDLPTGAGWGYEFKWDGVRAIAQVDAGAVRLFARSGAEITLAYPELTALGQAVPSAVLDGEIVALDAAGRPSFTTLAERIHIRDAHRAGTLAGTFPVTYMIFDVLDLDGADLCQQPYSARRFTLDSLALDADHWLCPPSFGDGDATQAAAEENHLEGLVAKRLASTYRPGTRSSTGSRSRSIRPPSSWSVAGDRVRVCWARCWSGYPRRVVGWPIVAGSAAASPLNPSGSCWPPCGHWPRVPRRLRRTWPEPRSRTLPGYARSW